MLQTPGWKQFARLAARKKKLQRMINAAKRKTKHHGPIFKFGIQVPQTGTAKKPESWTRRMVTPNA